jgi:4-hydroxy-tetrahydrodipicolinate synthase
VVTPFYNKPSPDGLFEHYQAVARASRLPIVVYNVPGRTGLNVLPATLARLADIDTVIGVKEASGDVSQIARVFQLVPNDFVVLSGDDALTLPVIALGGAGVISVAANEVPFAMARMVSLCLQGDFPGACEMHRRLHPLMEVNFVESNPGPVKAALSMMGHLDLVFRLPVVGPQRESLAQIEKVLLDLGLIPPGPDPMRMPEVPFGD